MNPQNASPAELHRDTVALRLSINGQFKGLDITECAQAVRDTLHHEALVEDAQRTAELATLLAADAERVAAQAQAVARQANANAIHLPATDYFHDDLLSGMFADMTHAEMTNPDHADCVRSCADPTHGVAYGEQEIVVALTEDYSHMFDLLK